jgi:hypothetical protein
MKIDFGKVSIYISYLKYSSNLIGMMSIQTGEFLVKTNKSISALNPRACIKKN